ncbi:MAG: sigma-70 family RNA polymerase sigma factor [Flammeovirgaceae bacterium]|nr:sigma-70 family RNA polymerase sigma factor [Flammeovirgaceae bacterium]
MAGTTVLCLNHQAMEKQIENRRIISFYFLYLKWELFFPPRLENLLTWIVLVYRPLLLEFPNWIANINLLRLFQILWASSSQFHKTEEEIKAEYQMVANAQKNPKFFAPIYEKYYDSIFIFVDRRIDEEDVTAEITSLVFYKCLKNIKKFQFTGVPFSAWLFRIAINEINQFFRSQKSHPRAVSLKQNHVEDLFFEISPGHVEVDKSQLVVKLLENLDPEELQFLELRFFEGRSFKEMGFLLELTEVNAKIKTYRILKKLKKIAKNQP